MGDRSVLLVTGVSSYWGAKLASRLLREADTAIIGIDAVEPVQEIAGLDFIAVDCRNPLLAELLRSESVSGLCHLDFHSSSQIDDKLSERNVSSLENVLAACAEAGVGRIVVKSSTAVYGARYDNSTFLTEESALRGSDAYGYSRDLLEIEARCSGFRSQWPEVGLTILRFANIVSAKVETPMTLLLSLPSPPILLGFDPMMQLVHEDDVVEALAHAMLKDKPGVFNVAAEDAMPLSRILRLARRVPTPIFHPLAYRGLKVLKGAGLEASQQAPMSWDYLRYSLVTDLSRMHEELGFAPAYTAAESLREFAHHRRAAEDDDGAAATQDEAWLRDIIQRRQRQKERQASAEGTLDLE